MNPSPEHVKSFDRLVAWLLVNINLGVLDIPKIEKGRTL